MAAEKNNFQQVNVTVRLTRLQGLLPVTFSLHPSAPGRSSGWELKFRMVIEPGKVDGEH